MKKKTKKLPPDLVAAKNRVREQKKLRATKLKSDLAAAKRRVLDGKPKKKPAPRKKAPSDAKRSERARNTVSVQVSNDVVERIKDGGAASTMFGKSRGGGSVNALANLILVGWLDAMEHVRKLSLSDASAAATIVAGGYVVKSSDVEGPFIHVGADGKIVRAGFPGSKHSVVARFENSEFDPKPTLVTTTEGKVEEYDDAVHEPAPASAAADAEDVAASDEAASVEDAANDFGEAP